MTPSKNPAGRAAGPVAIAAMTALVAGFVLGRADCERGKVKNYYLGGGLVITKRCPYVPGKCYAPRGLGPWQEVNCDDPSPLQCGSSCMRANKDVCSDEHYALRAIGEGE